MSNVREFQSLVAARRAAIDKDLAALNQLGQAQRQAPLERAIEVVEGTLGEALLPDLSAESCQRAARLVGYRPIVIEPPAVGIAAERDQLTAALATLEAEPDWAQRDTLLAPETGSLRVRLQELEEQLQPAIQLIVRCQQHPRWDRLIESGYDTDAYDTPFWRAAYYRDWEAGDQVLEVLAAAQVTAGPDVRFRDVRQRYLEMLETRAALEPAANAAKQRVDGLVARIERHKAIGTELATIETRHLAKWRKRLVSHVRALGLEHQDPALLAVPQLAHQVKALDGLAAKIRAMDELRASTAALAAELEAEKQKLGREQAKYQRPKNLRAQFAAQDLERRFSERPAKLRRRVDDLVQRTGAVHRFDRWDLGRIGEPFDWMPVLLGGIAVGVVGSALLDSDRETRAAANVARASRAQELVSDAS